jgi:hypothetical protein
MSSITRLPTAATSYIRVRRRGHWWLIELVTPIEGSSPITSGLARSNSRATAVQYATETGQRMQRPVRLSRGSS